MAKKKSTSRSRKAVSTTTSSEGSHYTSFVKPGQTRPDGVRTPTGSLISRYISFLTLVATICVFGFFFYNVIKGFLLPLFLAALLAVIFRPFHDWVKGRWTKSPALSAAISTAAIMLLVLLPLAGLVTLGLYEANQVVRSKEVYLTKISEVRASMGLQKPFVGPLDSIETEFRKLDSAFNEALNADKSYFDRLVSSSRNAINEQLCQLKVEARDGVARLVSADSDLDDGPLKEAANKLKSRLEASVGVTPVGPEYWDAKGELDAEQRSLKYLLSRSQDRPELGFVELVAAFASKLNAIPVNPPADDTSMDAQRPTTILEQHLAFTNAQVQYDGLRTALLGGPIWNRGIEMVNPSTAQINEWVAKLFTGGATRWLPSITNTATSLIMGLLVGMCIMAVALFYFFMDGPKMVNSLMRLSPMDDRHELELLQEFDKVSRAVVVATLLSAVAQGILGGIGYRLAGLDSIFLLTLLTAVFALIPFVGAAAIWVPCCLYIAFLMETPDPEATRNWMYAKAGFLAAYGVLIISMADNVIKPWVLQGQSKLHPLLALLSVLGGVQALGPIGILIGPMVVAFLQVLLTILQREIISLDKAMHNANA